MILNSWVLGLVTGHIALLFIYTIAIVSAWGIVKDWEFESNSERQYGLEKRTYLVSSVMKFALMIHLLMLFLLVVTADELAQILPGAMCATGTLAANDFGFPLFWLDLICFFIFFTWLVINRLDSQMETYPLIKQKYAILIIAFPLIVLKFVLLLLFVTNLKPGVITSCCGSVFTESSSGIGGTMAGVEPELILPVFFGTVAVIAMLNFRTSVSVRATSRLSAGMEMMMWVIFFMSGLLSIISFLSIYVYQLPTHQCPFCLLKPEYNYIGLPIYLGLFFGTAAGISSAVLRCFRSIDTYNPELKLMQKKLKISAGTGGLVFMLFGFGPFVVYYLRTGAVL